MLQTASNSYVGAVLPSFSERLSQAHSLIACIRGIEGVSLGSFQRSLQCEPQLLSSPPRASANFVVTPWRMLIVCGLGLPPSAQLIGFTVSGPVSFLFPYVSCFLSLPGWQQIRRVLPLPQPSNHCSSSLPGTVATASILATLILSTPHLSSYRLDHCGATPSKSAVTTICEFP